MNCIFAVALSLPLQDAPTGLSEEERREVEEYLHMFVTGPVPCGPSSVELIHRFGPGLVPYLARRMLEEPKYRSLCAQLLTGVAGFMGSMDADSEKALVRILKDEGKGATFAASALGSLCSEAARTDLLRAVDSESPYLVRAACLSLALLGGEGVRHKLAHVRASWQASQHRYKEEVLRAAGDALDLVAAFEAHDRKASLLKLMKTARSYDGMGWLYSSECAALRKAIQLDMKDLLPDLRRLADEKTGWKLPFLFAIHKLGGKVSDVELKSLRRHVYLMPLKKWTTGYLDDN